MTKSVLTFIARRGKEKLTGSRTRGIFPLIATLLLLGCSTQSSWIKDGSTREDYSRDSDACLTSFGRRLSRNDESSDVHERINMCMTARGWHRVNTEEAKKLIASPARRAYFTNAGAFLKDYAGEKQPCEKKVVAKEIRTFVAFSACADRNMAALLERHHIAGDNIAEKITEKHSELSAQLDARQITPAQVDKEASDYLKQVLTDAAPH